MSWYAHTKEGFLAALREVLVHRGSNLDYIETHMTKARSTIFTRRKAIRLHDTYGFSAWARCGGEPGTMTLHRLRTLPDGTDRDRHPVPMTPLQAARQAALRPIEP